jgi:molecular chaperone GrpE
MEKEKVLDKNEDVNCVENIEKAAREEKLSELEILKQSFEEMKKQKEDYYDQLIRLQADFANFRRRAEEEKIKFLEYGKEKVLEKQINIFDVLQQALKSAKEGGKIEDIIVGLDMIGKEFLKMLKEENVHEIELEKFDANFCEALEYAECDDEEGKILSVYQKGYKINGRLLRTAKVKVAKKKEDENKNKEEVK